jgi:hypothetical protein
MSRPTKVSKSSRSLLTRMKEAAELCGIREEAGAYQAPPAPFPDTFPKTAVLSTLQRRVWWWRFTVKGSVRRDWRHVFPQPEDAPEDYPDVQRQNFKDLLEPSAFFYEFRARYNDRYSYEFGVPWINCTWWQKWALRALIVDPFPDQYFTPTSGGSNHWVSVQLPVNLRSTDAAAKRRLVSELKRLRAEHGIKRGYVRTRDLPWMAVETMDLRRYKIDRIEPGGPSALSKARLEYEQECQRLGIAP